MYQLQQIRPYRQLPLRAVIDEAIKQFGKLDILFSVAGISFGSRFEQCENNTGLELLMNTNYWGPVNLTRHALPHLIKSQGRILVVSSGSAILPFAVRTGYGASKAAVQMFFDSLRWEVEPRHGISITTVTPNLTAYTRINSTRINSEGEISKFGNFSEKEGMNVNDVAKRILQGLANKEWRITFGLSVFTFLRELFPRPIERLINELSDKMMNHDFPLYSKTSKADKK
jgi:NAD(P)-dependent dehydrogenase (short-subunit alcohol dehydrogenase family)